MKLAVLLNRFEPHTPGQHLLDRFLMGYPRDGEFHRPEISVVAVLPDGKPNDELARRAKDFGLAVESDLSKAVRDAGGILIFSDEIELTRQALEHAAESSRCFVFGLLAKTQAAAQGLLDRARAKKIELGAGTALPVTWRLPQIEIRRDPRLREALVVAQGTFPQAEVEAIDALLDLVERFRPEAGVRNIESFRGEEVWKAGDQGKWSWPLLASAISRSDTPQGDPVKDGRTQDLVGLGLVPKLAREPRAWILEHRDRVRSAVLVLDGVVADVNAAWNRAGTIQSTQLFRPPKPALHEFSYLAAALEDFFRGGILPWKVERNVLAAGIHAEFQRMIDTGRASSDTPALRR